mgnify:CR=1 FL=1
MEPKIKSIRFWYFFKKKIIPREDGKDYLIRYSLFNCKFFSIKIHNILLSDDYCLHDHPWKFISFILKGGYWEHCPTVNQHKEDVTKTFDGVRTQSKWYGVGSLLVRPAHWIHRLELDDRMNTWTFVITFKKTKSWGFFTPKFGFIDFSKYNSEKHCD